MKIYELRAKIGNTLFIQSFATSEAALLKAYSIRNKCAVGGCDFAGRIIPQTANERGEFEPNAAGTIYLDSYTTNN
ncbi:MAG: hypothetical protein K2F74_06685 [Muribaculaceae bacterium]|nr:hypothetical protein [Muribaculaceae bacterium]